MINMKKYIWARKEVAKLIDGLAQMDEIRTGQEVQCLTYPAFDRENIARAQAGGAPVRGVDPRAPEKISFSP